MNFQESTTGELSYNTHRHDNKIIIEEADIFCGGLNINIQ